jgi:hypothetical protein
MENALKNIKSAGCDFGSLEQRISDLENRLQDIEDVIASFCDAPRKPGPFSSWLRRIWKA